MEQFNEMQLIKRRFFAMRNGVVADVLRKAGAGFRIIFGLNLPQIVEIASEIGDRPDLAERLWDNKSTRESMLLAPMIYGEGNVDQALALKMASEAPTAEVADVLCHRLLRKLPFERELAFRLASMDEDMCRYCAMRLLWHHVNKSPDEIRQMAVNEMARKCALTLASARQIVDEIDFWKEENA